MKRIYICNIPVDVLTMHQTISIINQAIEKNKFIHHVAVNAAKVVNAQKDEALKESIIHCDIINADGQSIVWAAWLLNTPLPERVAGIDLMESLVSLAAEKNYRIFFLGAREEVVLKVVEIYSNLYGQGIIAGYENGYFKKEEEPVVAKQISNAGADILFVAMGSPQKEIFLNTYKHLIKVPFVMGVGGSFDVIAGLVKRAPLWMQRAGLEWLYRIIQEPGRMWKRYLLSNVLFIFLIIKQKLGYLTRPGDSRPRYSRRN